MSYDIHGTWDGKSKWTESVVNPHTNLTGKLQYYPSAWIQINYECLLDISEGLDLLWRNDVDPAKVLLGLGFYGHSFKLNDTSCTYLNVALTKP